MSDKTTERQALEARAEELGVTFQANIGDEKLAARITAAEAAKAASGEVNEVAALRVIGPSKGFRRAGRTFTAEPVNIPLDELSKEDLAALEAEPRLITVRIGENAAAD